MDRDLEYRPCQVVTLDGRTHPRVYIMAARPYVRLWGIWPEEDPGKKSLDVSTIASVAESPFRMPLDVANRLYAHGENRMGSIDYVLTLRDGRKIECSGGNAIDFPPLPAGATTADVLDAYPARLGPSLVVGPRYAWCLYSKREAELRADLERAIANRHIGWVFEMARDAFSYLTEDFGFRIGEVMIHHESSFVSYRNGPRSVTIEYTPSSREIRCSIVDGPEDGLGSPHYAEAWDILTLRAPERDWLAWPRNSGDRNTVTGLIALWGEGLREYAPDVLRGTVADVPVFHWWMDDDHAR